MSQAKKIDGIQRYTPVAQMIFIPCSSYCSATDSKSHACLPKSKGVRSISELIPLDLARLSASMHLSMISCLRSGVSHIPGKSCIPDVPFVKCSWDSVQPKSLIEIGPLIEFIVDIYFPLILHLLSQPRCHLNSSYSPARDFFGIHRDVNCILW